jgi:hypothetical protein
MNITTSTTANNAISTAKGWGYGGGFVQGWGYGGGFVQGWGYGGGFVQA